MLTPRCIVPSPKRPEPHQLAMACLSVLRSLGVSGSTAGSPAAEQALAVVVMLLGAL